LRDVDNVGFSDEILVVEAPPDSEPNSPAVAIAPPLPPKIPVTLPADVSVSSSKPEDAQVDSQEKTSDNNVVEDDDIPWESGFEQISGSFEDIDTSSIASKTKTKPASSTTPDTETFDKPDNSRTQSQEDLLL
jgi:hypothetical protein